MEELSGVRARPAKHESMRSEAFCLQSSGYLGLHFLIGRRQLRGSQISSDPAAKASRTERGQLGRDIALERD